MTAIYKPVKLVKPIFCPLKADTLSFRHKIKWGCVKIEISYQCVILSIAKDLITSTLCKQILHFVQNDTT